MVYFNWLTSGFPLPVKFVFRLSHAFTFQGKLKLFVLCFLFSDPGYKHLAIGLSCLSSVPSKILGPQQSGEALWQILPIF